MKNNYRKALQIKQKQADYEWQSILKRQEWYRVISYFFKQLLDLDDHRWYRTGELKFWEKIQSFSNLKHITAAAAKSLQSCPTLCDPIDSSPPGSPVPGILQARTLEWVAISFSNAWKWKVKGKSLSRVQLFATPWTSAYQAPLSMGFSRQEYWSGVPSPSPETHYISA